MTKELRLRPVAGQFTSGTIFQTEKHLRRVFHKDEALKAGISQVYR
jgi:hypothetical protein